MELAGALVIESAADREVEAIANLNIAAYTEFAPQIPSGAWEMMQRNLRNISTARLTIKMGLFIC